ncbi:MAG: hypothetical protein AAB316_25170 [Bacteroidota bacterium]
MENIYDKAIKEIIEPSFVPLAAIVLGVMLEKTEQMKDKIQFTLEREGDHVKLLIYKNKKLNCILHLEFHVMDENIGLLMVLKKSMLKLKFGLQVRQFVIYMGSEKRLRRLKALYKDEFTEHKFTVVKLNSIPWRKFMQYNLPEVVTLAILGDYGTDSQRKSSRKSC